MNLPTLTPMLHSDGTMTALVANAPQPLTGATLFTLQLPTGLAQGVLSGRYFLARCGAASVLEREENWQIYLRRPLFVARHRQVHRQAEGGEPAAPPGEFWTFVLPTATDPGYHWLAEQPVGAPVNLLGPFGQGFTLAQPSRHLLLLATAERAATLLGLIELMLDRGGQVTLVLQGRVAPDHPLLAQLPIPVEVRLASTDAEWQKQLTETLRWADQLCAALPMAQLSFLADIIRRQRFRLEAGFAQLLVEADLACGVGACLACVIPVADSGFTRACVHGPVFDLTRLV